MSIVKNITSEDNLDWREIVINWEGMGDDVTEIKAGTPMDAEGNIANNGNCFGLMMGDVVRARSRARVVISGPVDLDEAEANSGITLTDEAKAAMRDVWFPGKSGGGLPTGGAPYQQLVTDGEGNAKWEDRLCWRNEIKTTLVSGLTWEFNELASDSTTSVFQATATGLNVLGAQTSDDSAKFSQWVIRINGSELDMVQDGGNNADQSFSGTDFELSQYLTSNISMLTLRLTGGLITTEAPSVEIAGVNIYAKALDYKYMPEGYPKQGRYSITWNGDATGLVQASGTSYFKVSDKVFTAAELLGAEVELSADGVTDRLVATEDVIDKGDGYVRIGEYVVSLSKPFGPFEFTGTYFIRADAFYVSGLYTVTAVPMSMRFLPLNELDERYSSGGIVCGTITRSATGNDYVCSLSYDDVHAAYNRGQSVICREIETGGFGANGVFVLSDLGVYSYSFMKARGDYAVEVIFWKEGFGDTYSTKYKMLNTDSGESSILMASSTRNSTKKFQITVDDSGTISATEVTT